MSWRARKQRSPRHKMPFDSMKEGLHCTTLWMTRHAFVFRSYFKEEIADALDQVEMAA
jgi:hypothetical protein